MIIFCLEAAFLRLPTRNIDVRPAPTLTPTLTRRWPGSTVDKRRVGRAASSSHHVYLFTVATLPPSSPAVGGESTDRSHNSWPATMVGRVPIDRTTRGQRRWAGRNHSNALISQVASTCRWISELSRDAH